MADPIKIIKNDHKVVEKLFKEYADLGDGALKTKKDLATQICDTLKLHADMEEKIMYPKLEEKFNKEDDKMVAEALAEHEVAKGLIASIESSGSEDTQFDAKIKVLHEYISHHVIEEEMELLLKTEGEFSKAELEIMGDEMEEFKKKHQ